MVWRMWQNKIPIKDNLAKRGILNESQMSCSFRCGRGEIVSHLFLEYPKRSEVRNAILKWLNVSAVLHNSAMEDFTQFRGSLECGKVKGERLKTIYFMYI